MDQVEYDHFLARAVDQVAKEWEAAGRRPLEPEEIDDLTDALDEYFSDLTEGR